MTLILNNISCSSPFVVLLKCCWKCRRPQTLLAIFDFLQPFLGYAPELFLFVQLFVRKRSEGNSFYTSFIQTAFSRAELCLFELTASKNMWSLSGGSRVTGDVHISSVLTLGTTLSMAKAVYRKMRGRKKSRLKSLRKILLGHKNMLSTDLSRGI